MPDDWMKSWVVPSLGERYVQECGNNGDQIHEAYHEAVERVVD